MNCNTAAAVAGSGRRVEIDYIRGAAIASVIVLHTVPANVLVATWSVFTIWQAVPIFIILMGLNGLQSFLRQHGDHQVTLKEAYSSGRLDSKLRRLLVPFCILWAYSLMLGLLRGSVYVGPLLVVGYLPYSGPGNYFIPIAVQFTLLAPLLYWAFSRRPAATAAAILALDLGFELAAPYVSLLTQEPFLYSACILRYGVAIALGMWVVGDERLISRRNWFVLPFAAVGFAYFVLFRAAGFALPFLPLWGTQNLVSFGWALLLVLLALKVLPAVALPTALSSPLARIGQASYAIFVLQIGFFAAGFFVVGVDAFRVSLLRAPHLVDMAVSLLLVLSANLCVCLVLGTVWQERFLSRWQPLSAATSASPPGVRGPH